MSTNPKIYLPLNDSLIASLARANNISDSLIAQHQSDSVLNQRLFKPIAIYQITAKPTFNKYTPSLFVNHQLKTPSLVLHERLGNNYKWMSLVILIALLLIVFVKQFNPKNFSVQLSNFFSVRTAVKQMRDDISLSNILSLSLLLVYTLTASLFIFQLLRFYRIFPKDDLSFFHFSMISLLLIVIYILKTLILKFAGLVFKATNETDEYLYNVLLFNMILGLILLPVVICIAYTKIVPTAVFFNSGIVLVLFFFIFRIVKGMQVGWSSSKISKFYLFLYLASLRFCH